MTAYYNEIDPKAAAWLRELIKLGMIAPGEVDERDIRDVRPIELQGFTQCHFFAGIGVWSYALRLAGWPDDRPVWTGSCPCQPFSSAGRGKGFTDERHLWPAWHWLISEYRPDVVFGEQVTGKHGDAWLDLVSTDLEAEGYAVGPVHFPACGVGAPHIRQRAYFVADLSSAGLSQRAGGEVFKSGEVERPKRLRGTGDMENSASDSRSIYPRPRQPEKAPADFRRGSAVNGHWADAEWVYCKDGKYRPVEPGTSPLAHGAPQRVGRLRGYGNAIVATAAAEVIRAYLDPIRRGEGE